MYLFHIGQLLNVLDGGLAGHTVEVIGYERYRESNVYTVKHNQCQTTYFEYELETIDRVLTILDIIE